MIAAEPALAVSLSGEQVDAAFLAVANFIDLKSPYTIGHAGAVAKLVDSAAVDLGWPDAEVETLRRAALVHDFGRLGISNAIWDKPVRSVPRMERVRLGPYLTDRMLQSLQALGPHGAIAVQHRERLDGSGYPRGLSGGKISRSARMLGAADADQAMREPRPYRSALDAAGAASELRAEVVRGRLDAAGC